MFFRRSKTEVSSPELDMGIIITQEIKNTLNKVYQFINILNDHEINLLTIGDDESGATIQVREFNIQSLDIVNKWLNRSITKVKRVSWVQIEITGHDNDGDYRSAKFEFKHELGDAFLYICDNSPIAETPLHQLLLVSHLS